VAGAAGGRVRLGEPVLRRAAAALRARRAGPEAGAVGHTFTVRHAD
jgi:hypothetical protein